MKTILIIGATGFLGRNLVKMLWFKYKEQFKIIEKGDANYIVKALNTTTKETFYFNISKKGKIKDVRNDHSFNNNHGHSH